MFKVAVALMIGSALSSACAFPAAALARPAGLAPGMLGRLCRGEEGGTPGQRAAALEEITAAVRRAGAGARGGALEQALAALAGAAAGPVVTRGDLDGDGRPDTVVAFSGCTAPVVAYRAAAPGQAVVLPGTDLASWRPLGGARVHRPGDVNGDGRPDLVVEYRTAGGSADNTDLYIYQWQGQGFATLFHDHLSNWRGENGWSLGAGTVTIQCRPLGPYEHKHSPDRQQTESFAWNRQTGRYELRERRREPVQTRLQQVSAAEELFQRGDYAGAAAAYRQVESYPAGESGWPGGAPGPAAGDPDKAAGAPGPAAGEPDWAAYARLRLGQIHALAGRRAEALAELSRAAAGPDPVGGLAAAFRAAYAAGDAAAGFAAAWQWLQRAAAGDAKAPPWPALFDRHVAGARRAMLEAHRRAGRPAPADLPEPREFPPADCLQIGF